MKNRANRLGAAVGVVVRRLFSAFTGWIANWWAVAEKRRRDAIRWLVEPLEQRLLFTVLPSWVNPDSDADWYPLTNTLVAVGPTTIDADPGTSGTASEPIISADGLAAQIDLNLPAPTGTTPQPIHIGGLSLTDGASLEIESAGAARSEANHYVLVVGETTLTAAPQFTIDSTSTLDIEDNDLIVLYGSGSTPYTNIKGDIKDAADGTAWDMPGLTSSVARYHSGNEGIGYAEASALGDSSFDGITLNNGGANEGRSIPLFRIHGSDNGRTRADTNGDRSGRRCHQFYLQHQRTIDRS